MVCVVVVYVAAAHIERGSVAGRRHAEVAAVDGDAVVGVANQRRVHGAVGDAVVCIVCGAVKALAADTEGVAVQVRLAATLPHVLVARVRLAVLVRKERAVVKDGVPAAA